MASLFPLLAPYKVYLIAILGATGGIVILTAVTRFSRYRPNFPAIPCDFKILSETLHYRHLDATHMVHSKTLKVKALKNGLNGYPDRYTWTGDGRIEVKCPIRGQTFRETGSMTGWRCYTVDFGRTLRRGEECEVEVVFELEDLRGRAEPFLSTTVREPTDDLVLKVTLPIDPGNAICEVRTDESMLVPVSTKQISFDRNGTAMWAIRKPQLLHNYEMRWIKDHPQPAADSPKDELTMGN